MAKKKTYPGNDARNVGIIAASATGKTQKEIADDFNCSRETVNRVLNSDEAKRLTEQARSGLQTLLHEAVDTLGDALRDRHTDTNTMRTAVTAALAMLKGSGVLTEKVEHAVLKPFIMKLIDGGEIVMGHRPEGKGDSNGEES